MCTILLVLFRTSVPSSRLILSLGAQGLSLLTFIDGNRLSRPINCEETDHLLFKLTGRITRDAFQHLSIYFTIPAAFGETRKGVGYGKGAATERCEWKLSKELNKVL